MEKMIEEFEKLLNDHKTSEETKEAIREMLKNEKERLKKLSEEMDRILRE